MGKGLEGVPQGAAMRIGDIGCCLNWSAAKVRWRQDKRNLELGMHPLLQKMRQLFLFRRQLVAEAYL